MRRDDDEEKYDASSSLCAFRQLQKENEELKQLVTEHRSVLEKIMQKYREHVQQLQLMEEKEKIAAQLFNA